MGESESTQRFEFIALKEKESTNAVSIFFFRRDTDKIISLNRLRTNPTSSFSTVIHEMAHEFDYYMSALKKMLAIKVMHYPVR